jgi:hypothetical protein
MAAASGYPALGVSTSMSGFEHLESLLSDSGATGRAWTLGALHLNR